MKRITVNCTQTVKYTYDLIIPDNLVDVEGFVANHRRDCDEYAGLDGAPVEINEYSKPIIDSITIEKIQRGG